MLAKVLAKLLQRRRENRLRLRKEEETILTVTTIVSHLGITMTCWQELKAGRGLLEKMTIKVLGVAIMPLKKITLDNCLALAVY